MASFAVPKQAAKLAKLGRRRGGRQEVVEEMTAFAERDADGVARDGDVPGHGVAGPIRLGIGRGGWTGRVSRGDSSKMSCPQRSFAYLKGRLAMPRTH